MKYPRAAIAAELHDLEHSCNLLCLRIFEGLEKHLEPAHQREKSCCGHG